MRKRVGFQYNADEDTVDDITMEMLENLSLMPQQVSSSSSSSSSVLSFCQQQQWQPAAQAAHPHMRRSLARAPPSPSSPLQQPAQR